MRAEPWAVQRAEVGVLAQVGDAVAEVEEVAVAEAAGEAGAVAVVADVDAASWWGHYIARCAFPSVG